MIRTISLIALLVILVAQAGWSQENTHPWPAIGNIGIGLSNPVAKLHLKAPDDSWAAGIRIEDDASSNYYDFVFDDRLRIGYNAVTRFVLTADGSVGLGTATPQEMLTLQVPGIPYRALGVRTPSGELVATLVAGNPTGAQLNLSDSTEQKSTAILAGQLTAYAPAAENAQMLSLSAVSPGVGGVLPVLQVLSSGNVGIGTTSPSAKLEINGGALDGIRLGLVDQSYYHMIRSNGDGIYIGADDGNTGGAGADIRLGVGGSEKLRVQRTGNVGIGTTSPGNVLTIAQNSATDPIADSWGVYSSSRWKTNIEPIERALDKVQRLRGVSFEWKADGRHDIGLIGEEIGTVIPEVVTYEENAEDAKSVDYARLVAVLIEAIKEQQRQIEELRTVVSDLAGER